MPLCPHACYDQSNPTRISCSRPQALRTGAIGTPDEAVRPKVVLLLTDGMPNMVPPRGHVTELNDYFEKHPDFQAQLHTFG